MTEIATQQHAWTPPTSGVPREYLTLWNAAMSHMGQPLALPGKSTSLRLSPIASPDLKGPSHAVKLQSGELIHIHLDAFPFESLLGVKLDLEAVRTLEGPIFDAIYEGAGAVLFGALPDYMVAGAKVQEMVSPSAMAEKSTASKLVWFAAALDGLATDSIFFSIGAKADEICGLLKGQSIEARTVMDGLKQHVTSTALRLIGHAVLSLDEMIGLEAGDLLMVKRVSDAGINLLAENRIHTFEQVEEGWQCQSVIPLEQLRKAPTMTDTENEAADAAVNDAATDAPEMGQTIGTMLTFDLGETPVTLADLESFQAGALVLLPEAVTQNGLEVTIRAGGKPIATGDLVEVDDRIAVRIGRLLVQNGQ